MSENEFEIKISKWEELGLFFKSRFSTPAEHPEYILYFFLIVIGFGAMGVWTSIYVESQNAIFNHHDLIANISSFSIAIMATGSIELMFIKNEVIGTSLFFITLILIVIGVIAFLVSMSIDDLCAYYVAIPVALLALLVWWIANAENANLTKNFFKEQSNATKKFNESLDKYDEQ